MVSGRAVYPRWRGEHERVGYRPELEDGLSPLARGTRPRWATQSLTRRFIPAGAGNTILPWMRTGYPTVYPRWRGEHQKEIGEMHTLDGLSPLARGTPRRPGLFTCVQRFIPAGAGNTDPETAFVLGSAVYPRWRGEHTKDILLFYNSFLSTQQFTNFITTISHY